MKNDLISKDVKNTQIQIRVSEADKARLVIAAGRQGLSSWLLNVALEKIAANKK